MLAGKPLAALAPLASGHVVDGRLGQIIAAFLDYLSLASPTEAQTAGQVRLNALTLLALLLGTIKVP